jgi:hypothetical protein
MAYFEHRRKPKYLKTETQNGYGRALRVRAERAMGAALENTAKPVAP